MKRPKLKATGKRGSWFATVDGELLPCVHDYWLIGATHHCDPGIQRGIPEHDELIAAIEQSQKVILTSDVLENGKSFRRTGYIGLFAVGPVVCDSEGLQFDLTERLADLK